MMEWETIICPLAKTCLSLQQMTSQRQSKRKWEALVIAQDDQLTTDKDFSLDVKGWSDLVSNLFTLLTFVLLWAAEWRRPMSTAIYTYAPPFRAQDANATICSLQWSSEKTDDIQYREDCKDAWNTSVTYQLAAACATRALRYADTRDQYT